jgi:hypothetical protein
MIIYVTAVGGDFPISDEDGAPLFESEIILSESLIDKLMLWKSKCRFHQMESPENYSMDERRDVYELDAVGRSLADVVMAELIINYPEEDVALIYEGPLEAFGVDRVKE